MSSRPSAVTIRRAGGSELERLRPQLGRLLRETVQAGASLGFLPPLSDREAQDYWAGVRREAEDGRRIVLWAAAEGEVIGTVQLKLAEWPNARHRAEVQKLMVRPGYRRRGVGRALMAGLEEAARRAGRTLLLLDTREGDAANHLYRSAGWIELGRIPGYVREPGGEHATVIWYRTLSEPDGGSGSRPTPGVAAAQAAQPSH